MRLSPGDRERFERFVSHEPNSGCWLWTGTLVNGYGRFFADGRLRGAHRVSFAMYKGALRGGAFICHHCDNPACVNPDHLYSGTAGTNADDRRRRGRCAPEKARDKARAKWRRWRALNTRPRWIDPFSGEAPVAPPNGEKRWSRRVFVPGLGWRNEDWL